jgi:WD40 repeat protein
MCAAVADRADSLEAVCAGLVAILDSHLVPIGVGCLVEGGFIVTCAHVVATALGNESCAFQRKPPRKAIDCAFVGDADAPRGKAVVRGWVPARPDFEIPRDGRADVAVLKFRHAPPPAARPLFFDQPSSPWNQHFVAVGFPDGLKQGVTTRGTTQGNVLTRWIQLESSADSKQPLQPGFSGGPAILEGRFAGAGIVAVVDNKVPGAGWLIPASVLLDVLRETMPTETTRQAPLQYGRLYQSPGLPSFYVDRPSLVGALKRALLGTDRAVAVTAPGPGPAIGVHGMGGIGKTVLAARLIEDPEVRQTYPDGIYWVALGESPNILAVLGALVRELSGAPPLFTTVEEGSRALVQAIDGRKVLVVLDDVWQVEHAAHFRAMRPPARLVVTTRISQIVSALDAQSFAVDVLDHAQAMDLLRERASTAALASLDADPMLRDELLRATGRLPLALAMVASMVKETGAGWRIVVDALRRSRLDLVGSTLPGYERYGTLYDAINAGVARLPEAERGHYLDLAIFPEDRSIPLNSLRLLWFGVRGLEAEALQVATRLVGMSLANWTGDGMLRLHDLQRSFVVGIAGKDEGRLVARHRRLVEGYEAACEGRYDRLEDDGYVFDLLPWHMHEAGAGRALSTLLLDFDWLSRKLLATASPVGLWHDLVAFGGSAPHRHVEQALRHSAPALARGPGLLAQQLCGRLDPTEDPSIEHVLVEAHAKASRPALLPRGPSLRERDTALYRSLERHRDSVRALALTADGRRAVSASDDHTLKVWDVEAGTLLHSLEGHAGRVLAVALAGDGRRAVSASQDRTLKVWDVEAGTLLHSLEGDESGINAVALTVDGRRAVSGSDDGTLKVWDVEARTLRCSLERHAREILAVALTADGRLAVSASADRTLKVWDVEAGTMRHSLDGHSGRVRAVALTADGRRAVSASDDCTLKVWDVEAGTLRHNLKGHKDSVRAVALTADRRRVVSASDDCTLKVWDVEAGTLRHGLEGHEDRVRAVAVTADGRRAVSASADHTLKVWDVETGTLRRSLEGHAREVLAVVLTADGRRAVSASADHTVKVWDVEAGARRHSLEAHAGQVLAVALANDGRRAVSTSDDCTLKVWDVEAGKLRHNRKGHKDSVRAVALTADGRLAVSASDDCTLKVWDVEAGTLRHSLEGHEDWVNAVVLTADGRRAVSASDDHTLMVWDVEAGTLLHCLKGHEGRVLAVVLAEDGRRAASASDDNTLKVWDVEAGKLRQTLRGHEGAVVAAALNADGRRAVSASADGTLKVWDVETGKLRQTLKGHAGVVPAVALTADGRRAVSASDDCTLKVWDIKAGTLLHSLEGHESGVNAVALTMDGRRVVSASQDRTLKVWDVEAGIMLCELIGSASISCAAVDARSRLIVCGDALGRFHMLDLIE